MNDKARTFFKNCSYSISTNVFSFFVSFCLIFVVPKFIGVEEYGYWQLYLFYVGYIGFFHLGWIDGLYLKHGGKSYCQINKEDFITQFWFLNLLEVTIVVIVLLYVIFYVEDPEKNFIGMLFAFNILIIIPKTFLSYVLLSVNYIQKHAVLLMVERLTFLILVMGVLFANTRSFQSLIFSDVISKSIVLCLACYYCRDIISGKFASLQVVIPEIKENIISGSKMMLGNIAGMLMLGIIRFAIDQHWGVVVFGKVSIALGGCSFFMAFIGAINVVLFPILRRMDPKKMAEVYQLMNEVLTAGCLGVLSTYYVAVYVLYVWLPNYTDSGIYLALLFPLCVYETKWSIILYTYLKSLRKETWIFKVNLFMMILSILFTICAVYIFDDLFLLVLSISLLAFMRNVLGEKLLVKFLNIQTASDNLKVFILCAIFVFSAYTLPAVYGSSLYIMVYAVYLLRRRHKIMKCLDDIKVLLAG